MTVQITIIGLNQVGASVGLALNEHKELVQRTGNDREPTVARQAEKIGAVDKVSYNLPSAARSADIILLAVPVDDVRQTLTAIAQDLREGAVVIDTSFNKSAVAQWAQELMPEKTYFVGWTPALNPAYFEQTAEGIQAARADMFKSSPILITALPGAPTQAIRLAVDLATMIGAQPLFADTDEVDGLIALGHQLPQLVSVALANTALAQPGWREARKLAGQNFAEMTHPVTRLDEYKALGQSALLNQANVVRVLDEMIESLARLRNLVAENDQQGLQAAMDQAINGRILWLKQRQEAKWATEDLPPSDTTSAGDVLGRLIGLGKKPGDTRKKK